MVKTHSTGSLKTGSFIRRDKEESKTVTFLPTEKIEINRQSLSMDAGTINALNPSSEKEVKKKKNYLQINDPVLVNLTSLEDTGRDINKDLNKKTAKKRVIIKRVISKKKSRSKDKSPKRINSKKKINSINRRNSKITAIKKQLKNQYRIFVNKKVHHGERDSIKLPFEIKKNQFLNKDKKVTGILKKTNKNQIKDKLKDEIEMTIVKNVLRTIKNDSQKNSNNHDFQNSEPINSIQFSSTLKKFFVQNKKNPFDTYNSQYHHYFSKTAPIKNQANFLSQQNNSIPIDNKLDSLQKMKRTINNFQSRKKNNSFYDIAPTQYILINNDTNITTNSHYFINKKKTQSVTPEKLSKKWFQSNNITQSPTKKNFGIKFNHRNVNYLFPMSNNTSTDTLSSPHLGVYRSVSPYFFSREKKHLPSREEFEFPKNAGFNQTMPSKKLSSVNEINKKKDKMAMSTYSNAMIFMPSSINDLMLLLIKKMLVYSSKVESLQQKILINNPMFSPEILIRNIKMTSKTFITLHDIVYFSFCFGFKVSDWEAFRLMCYLSKYTLASLEELVIQEKIDEASINVIPSQYFETRRSSVVLNQDKEANVLALSQERPKYYINSSFLFEFLFPSFQFSQAPKMLKKMKRNPHKIHQREYFLIQKILFLTFRKIEEIGIIIHHIRKHSLEKIFQFFSEFNDKSRAKNSKYSPIVNKKNTIEGKLF